MTTPVIVTIIIAAFGFVSGIIGYFLKRTMNRVDCTEQELHEVKETYAKKEDLQRLEQNSERAFEKLEKRLEERFDATDNEIKNMKKDHLLKEDFYREVTNLDKKMQKVIDLLIEGRSKE